jgi:hypothetical protein
MQEQLKQRLQELRAEFEKGEQTLQELETQAATVRQTLLRISGAIQVLEEVLDGTDEPRQDGTEPTGQANGGVAERVEQAAGEAGLRLTAER